jgi:uncharacterized protein
MIECPWCTETVEIIDDICPNCKHEVLLDRNGNLRFLEDDIPSDINDVEESIGQMIVERFKCVKCANKECEVNKVAMTGTGISKMLDIQHNHYLFVTCLHCGYVEVYNPDILSGKKSGTLGTVVDMLFGG